MAEGGKYTENFYAGADYGFNSESAKEYSIGFSPTYPAATSEFGLSTDPRTANQIDAVSKKLNTGAKIIELEGLQSATLENIPKQHFAEINRLRKLTGVDLTFHGPLVEPTGVTTQGWNESHREQAERQMWHALERAHDLDPDGNVLVTFHSSNSFPDPVTKVMTEVVDSETGEKKMKEVIKGFWVVDQASGRFEPLTPKPDYFKSKEKVWGSSIEAQEKALKDVIEKQSKDVWFRQLQGVSFHANQGSDIIENVLAGKGLKNGEEMQKKDIKMLEYYKSVLEGSPKAEVIESLDEEGKKGAQEIVHRISHGNIYLRDAYQDLQTLFNQAYETAKKNNSQDDLKKLNAFREEIKSEVKDIEDPLKMGKFADTIIKGVNVLNSITPPQSLKPLREFGIEQSSETFSNLALSSYKKFGDTAPIISIENPPAGMGLARAEDLRDIIDKSRKMLQQKLVEEENLSHSEAEKQAEKLIGATWDVGHINMIRKYGYEEKDVIKDTEKIAKYVNKVHLSDNFGMEHTELPMGMGNVPTKAMLEAIQKYNKQVKKIIETGTWFGPQAFGNLTPFKESLRAFGSPFYSMKMGPYWNKMADTYGAYFSGQGRTLPDQHFSMYGAGFSMLPPELGGQMAGRSRASGAPIE